MTSLPLLLLVLATGADTHLQKNSLYREIRETGVTLSDGVKVKMPVPLCADGMTSPQQQMLLEKIVGDEFRLSEFTRQSQVSPYRLRLSEIKPAAPNSVTRQVEAVFVAYGDLKKIASKSFLDRAMDLNRKEGKAQSLTSAQLQKRGITVPADRERHEGYAYLVFNLIDKVELNLVGQSIWSETDDSIVVAGRLDPRFLKDAEFPNQWKPITRNDRGQKVTGKPVLYSGAAYYVKITQLKNIKGALLVEGHVIFNEPKGWFDGTNLLRSKLPPVMQSQVRTFRRELGRAK